MSCLQCPNNAKRCWHPPRGATYRQVTAAIASTQPHLRERANGLLRGIHTPSHAFAEFINDIEALEGRKAVMNDTEKKLMRQLIDEYLNPASPPKKKDQPTLKSTEALGATALAIVLDQLHERPPGVSAFLMQCGRFGEALRPTKGKTA